MISKQNLETMIIETQCDVNSQKKYLEKNYDTVEEDEDGNFNRYTDHGLFLHQLSYDEVNKFRLECDHYKTLCDHLNYLYELLEHRKKMLHVLTKAKTYVEVKLLQKSDILNVLNDDVKIVIAGYLTGISNKPIEKQLRLF